MYQMRSDKREPGFGRPTYDELMKVYCEQEKRMLGRNWRIEGWRRQFLMDGRYAIPAEGKSVLGNQWYTTVKLATALGSRNQLYLRAPTDNTPQGKLVGEGKESFGYALLDGADHYAFLRGHDLFRHEFFQGIVVDGWYAASAVLDLRSDDRYDPFKVKLIDPTDVYVRYTDDGQDRQYERYITTVGDAEARYDCVLGNNKDEIVYLCSCWYYDEDGNVWNTVWLLKGVGLTAAYVPPSISVANIGYSIPYHNSYSQEYLLRDEMERTLPRLPLVTGPVGGAHWRQQNWNATVSALPKAIGEGNSNRGVMSGTGMSNEEEWGHPLLYSIDHLTTHYNNLLSDLTELVDSYIHPTLIVETLTGEVKEIKLGEDNYLKKGEVAKLLYIQGTPPPFMELLKLLSDHMDEGGLPSALRRGPNDAQTGFLFGYVDGMAHNQLIRAISARNMATREIIALGLEQYKNAPEATVKKIQEMWGTDYAGSIRRANVEPALMGSVWMNVETILATPQNEIQRANYAAILKQNGFASKETGRDILHIPDKVAEGDRVLYDMMLEDPVVRQAVALSRLIANDQQIEATALSKQMGINVKQPGGGLVGPDGRSPIRINSNTGYPDRKLPSSDVLPPAMSQGQPNPEVATANGVAPAGAKLGGATTSPDSPAYERLF